MREEGGAEAPGDMWGSPLACRETRWALRRLLWGLMGERTWVSAPWVGVLLSGAGLLVAGRSRFRHSQPDNGMWLLTP